MASDQEVCMVWAAWTMGSHAMQSGTWERHPCLPAVHFRHTFFLIMTHDAWQKCLTGTSKAGGKNEGQLTDQAFSPSQGHQETWRGMKDTDACPCTCSCPCQLSKAFSTLPLVFLLSHIISPLTVKQKASLFLFIFFFVFSLQGREGVRSTLSVTHSSSPPFLLLHYPSPQKVGHACKGRLPSWIPSFFFFHYCFSDCFSSHVFILALFYSKSVVVASLTVCCVLNFLAMISYCSEAMRSKLGLRPYPSTHRVLELNRPRRKKRDPWGKKQRQASRWR